jgi:ribose transport system permease protein
MPKIDLSGLKKYSAIFILFFLMVLFSFTNPHFLTVRNITNLVIQNTYIIIIAVGISFVMIGHAIDLSIGFQISLVGVVTAISMFNYHNPVWLSVLLGILLGTLLGFINGMIVANIQVFPLLATLATSALFQGTSFLISRANVYRDFPEEFLLLTRAKVLGIPFDILLALFVILLASFIYNETVFGFRVFALGGSEEGSRLAGINIRRMKLLTFTLCGFFTAIGTMLFLSRRNLHSSNQGIGVEITCLTAAIIGGISIRGGEGTMTGLVAAIFVLAVVGNGMQLAGWGTYAQYVVQGIILLVAIVFDEYQKKALKTQRKK